MGDSDTVGSEESFPFKSLPLDRPLKVQQPNPLVRKEDLGFVGGGGGLALRIRSRTGAIPALLDRDRLISGKADQIQITMTEIKY